MFMRIARSVVLIIVSSISLVAADGATADPSGVQIRQTAERLFRTGALPLIFVGKITEADRGFHVCRVTCGIRWARFSVTSVTWGFTPGDDVRVAFGGAMAPPMFSRSSDVLVFAVESDEGIVTSTGVLLLEPTDGNLRMARQIAESHVQHIVANYKAHHTNWEKLAFAGTIVELWPQSNASPQPCKQARPFPVTFRVDQLLIGTWPDAKATIVFHGCDPPPDPPLRVGQNIIVLAGIGEKQDLVVYLKDILPMSELSRVRRELIAVTSLPK
jgi:hypothetical protein